MKKLLLALLLFPCTAFAVAPELCGSGFDEPGNTGGTPNGTDGSCPAGYGKSQSGTGCDLLCPGADGDNDGYTSTGQLGTANSTAIDCDDTDKWIYPGVWTGRGCTAGNARQCHATNGTFSSCVAESTICEATGGGSCYHIDCTSGNDANAGTYAAPFKTFGKVSGGSGASGLPASPVTLTAGSVVYVRPFLCNTTITTGLGLSVIGEFNANGTSTNPITIKAFPRSGGTSGMPFVYNTDGAGLVGSGAYYKISGLGFYTATVTQTNGLGLSTGGGNWTVDSNFFLQMLGNGSNNDSCIYFSHMNGGKAFRNILHNCSSATGNNTNLSAIKWLDDKGIATECQNHEAKWNTVSYDTAGVATNGTAFMGKHGCEEADVGVNKHQIKHNRVVNASRVLRWEGSSLRMADNLAVGGDEIGIVFVDSSTARNQDNEITDNSFVDVSGLQWNGPRYVTPEKLRLLRNIIRDDATVYNGGNNNGVYNMDSYGTVTPGGDRDKFETSPFYLESNNNCFYNPNTALVFSYFNQGDSSGQFSFANWRLRAVPYDAASFVENPNFDIYYKATSANCLNKGVQFTAATTPTSGSTNNLGVAGRVFLIKKRKR